MNRTEVPPTQQLEDLRKARDHYNALADQIHNSPPESGESRADHRAREENARRVATAYDNSAVIQQALLPRDGD